MKRSPHKPIVPSTLTPSERLHLAFINALGDRKLATYTDGGATDRGRQQRRARGRAAKHARKRQRRR